MLQKNDLDKGYLTYPSNELTRSLLLNEGAQTAYLVYKHDTCLNELKRGFNANTWDGTDASKYEPAKLKFEVVKYLMKIPGMKLVRQPIVYYIKKRNIFGIEGTVASNIKGENLIMIRIGARDIEEFVLKMMKIKEEMKKAGVKETPKQCRWRLVGKL